VNFARDLEGGNQVNPDGDRIDKRITGECNSYVPVGSKQSLRRQIGIPVENRVFFAGEATSQFFPATVHGAFLSGVRAAYEIKLADAKVDLMKDGEREVDIYV
jgi:hypothetical protein